MVNPNYSEVLSTTFANHRASFTDNVFSRRALAFWLKKNDRVKMKSGGQKIVLPIHLDLGVAATSYDRGDALAWTTATTGTAAEYPWKRAQVPIVIDRLDQAINAGESEIIDLLEEKVKQAEETFTQGMNSMWFGDGTGNSGKNWNGLLALIGDNTDAVTTVGGIDCTTGPNATWRSYVVKSAAAGVFSAAGLVTGTPKGIDVLRKAVNTTTYGADKCDLILTHQDLYETFEATLAPLLRYNDTSLADAGFENFTYKNIPVVFDEQIPNPTIATQRYMFGINSKHIGLYGLSSTWFQSDPFEIVQGTDIWGTHMRAYGNMAIDSRRSCFRIEYTSA